MVTIEQLYKALRAKDASAIQAAAITGNAVSEVGPSTSDLSPDSELNPEFYTDNCCGLWCWEPVFFNPPRPTGNSLVDMDNQIDYLKANGGFDRATGADAEEAGRNFALNYERCEFCGVGEEQWINRGNQAAAVARLAAEDGWDKPPTPPKQMHYERYWKPEMVVCAERYDALKELQHRGKITKQEAGWLEDRRKEAGRYVTEIHDLAIAKGSRAKPNWNEHRGWLEQQMLIRSRGDTCEPTT